MSSEVAWYTSLKPLAEMSLAEMLDELYEHAEAGDEEALNAAQIINALLESALERIKERR